MPFETIQIPLAKSDIGQAEKDAVGRVMASGRLALGPEINAFELEFAAWHNVRAASMTNSGTSALTCALRAMGIGPGDEVIMPALTFVGTANAILNCGAIPVLVDVQSETGNINPDVIAAAINERTKAIVPVHLFGRPADLAATLDIAHEHSLFVIEDAAEAIGSRFRGSGGESDTAAGAVADAGIFGFYPNKILTTGEGGMVISDDDALISRCKTIANQGVGVQTSPGMSFRGNELGAAIGRVQLASLTQRLASRAALATVYQHQLVSETGLNIFGFHDANRSWFTCPVLLPAGCDRIHLRAQMANDGIATAEYFPAVHTLPGYANLARSSGALPVSEMLGEHLLALPFWVGIESHIEFICERLAFHLHP